MKLSKTLSKYRQQNNYTQSQLANKLHVSRKTISNWENGRSEPNFEFLKELSHLYNVSTDQLLAVSTTTNPKTPNSKVTFASAWKSFGKNLFRLKGKTSREGYNYVMVPLMIFPFVLIILEALLALMGIVSSNLSLILISDVLVFIGSIFVEIWLFCLVARRSHDVGLGTWPAIISFVPWMGPLYMLILMFLPKDILKSNK